MNALVAIAAVIAAWNPALFAERSPSAGLRRRAGWMIGTGIVLLLAAATGPILDLFDVSVPTFRTAAGAVVALVGARWLIGAGPRDGEGDPLAHGLMDVGTPEIVAAAMAAGSYQWFTALVGVGVALALVIAVTIRGAARPTVSWLRRTLGGGAVLAGVVLIYAGIRAV